MYEISLASLTLHDVDPVNQIELAAAVGFDALQLSLAPPPELHGPTIIGNRDLERGIRSAMKSTGIRLLDADTFRLLADTDVTAWIPALDFAAELGLRYILASSDDPNHDRTAERLAALGELAGERGLGVALEFLSYRTVGTLDAALKVATAAARNNVGLVVDILHLMRSGGTVEQLGQVDPAKLYYAHVCDVATLHTPSTREALIAESVSNRLLPGEGVFNLDGFLRAFGRPVPLSVEAPFREGAGLPARIRAERAYAAARALVERVANDAPA